jgi:hypothetical protein
MEVQMTINFRAKKLLGIVEGTESLEVATIEKKWK